jgi:hypothetical protein
VAAPARDDNCSVKEEEKNHEIIQETPCAEVADQVSDAKAHDDGGRTDEERKDEEIHATTDTNEGERIAQQVEAKLAIQQGPAEAEAKDAKEEGLRLRRGSKKADKAAAKGAIVPIDDDTDDDEVAAPEGVKEIEKAAVVPVDHEIEGEVVVPAGQAPAAAPVASDEAAEAAGAEVTKGGNACEEKAHEE